MYFLLVKKNLDEFTVMELREKFHQYGLSSANQKKDRQFLYRQLFTLESKGLLKKEGINNSRAIRYSKTKLFFDTDIIPKTIDCPDISVIRQGKSMPKIDELKSTLNQYQIKLVTSLGESEEYQRIIKEFPDIDDQIRKSYYDTRELSGKYLGKINALKKIIKRYQA